MYGKEANGIKVLSANRILCLALALMFCFISVGYAQVSTNLSINGSATISTPYDIYISNVSPELQGTVYFGTTLKTDIDLRTGNNNTVTFSVTITNASKNDVYYSGTLVAKDDPNAYSNPNIDFNVDMSLYTKLAKESSITFNLTFKPKDGATLNDTTLLSIIQFQFSDASVLPTDPPDNPGGSGTNISHSSLIEKIVNDTKIGLDGGDGTELWTSLENRLSHGIIYSGSMELNGNSYPFLEIFGLKDINVSFIIETLYSDKDTITGFYIYTVDNASLSELKDASGNNITGNKIPNGELGTHTIYPVYRTLVQNVTVPGVDGAPDTTSWEPVSSEIGWTKDGVYSGSNSSGGTTGKSVWTFDHTTWEAGEPPTA